MNLRLEEQRLERYLIRASFAGTVIDVIAEPGAMLTDTDNVLMLADLDVLEAQLNLPIELFGSLTVGDRYVLVADVPVNKELTWRLKTSSPAWWSAGGGDTPISWWAGSGTWSHSCR